MGAANDGAPVVEQAQVVCKQYAYVRTRGLCMQFGLGFRIFFEAFTQKIKLHGQQAEVLATACAAAAPAPDMGAVFAGDFCAEAVCFCNKISILDKAVFVHYIRADRFLSPVRQL